MNNKFKNKCEPILGPRAQIGPVGPGPWARAGAHKMSILSHFAILQKMMRLVRTSFLPRTARRDLSYESENSRKCCF